MFKQKVITPRTYNPEKGVRAISDRTMTVPDQSLTVKQILDRFGCGMPPVGVLHDPVYSEDPDGDFDDNYISPDVKQNFDLTDIDEIKTNAKHAERKLSELRAKEEAEELNRKAG